MLGMFGWSIVLSMNSQVGFGNPEISECQKSYEAMLAGKWDIAKQLLADMKKRNIKADSEEIDSEFSACLLTSCDSPKL